MLQVGVGYKTDGGIKSKVGTHRWITIGIEWQPAHAGKHKHTQQKPKKIDAEQCQQMLFPGHLLSCINAA